MNRVKKYLLYLFGIMVVLVSMIGCEKDNGSGEVLQLRRLWKLSTFCDAPADVDIYINLGTDGRFTIYQRTEDLSFSVFEGEYSVDEENSILSGVYSDNTPWASSYRYELDVVKLQLLLESVESPNEVAIYKPAVMPKINTRSISVASVSDVKPL